MKVPSQISPLAARVSFSVATFVGGASLGLSDTTAMDHLGSVLGRDKQRIPEGTRRVLEQTRVELPPFYAQDLLLKTEAALLDHENKFLNPEDPMNDLLRALQYLSARWTELKQKEGKRELTPADAAELKAMSRPPDEARLSLRETHDGPTDKHRRLFVAAARICELTYAEAKGHLKDGRRFGAAESVELRMLRKRPAQPEQAALEGKAAVGTLTQVERLKLDSLRRLPDDPLPPGSRNRQEGRFLPRPF